MGATVATAVDLALAVVLTLQATAKENDGDVHVISTRSEYLIGELVKLRLTVTNHTREELGLVIATTARLGCGR